MEQIGRNLASCEATSTLGLKRGEKRGLSDAEREETSKKHTISDTKDSDHRERRPSADSDAETLTHKELLELTSSTLDSLLRGDSVLSDLPADVTVEEVAAQIALMQGQSMTVTVVQEDGKHLNAVVAQSGTVTDLKRSIQRHVTLKLGREGRSHVKVNWRYVWRSNWLALPDGTKLTQDNARLADVGVRNRSRVKYVKRLDDKHGVR